MVKLFTHTDLDGIGCAVLAKYVFTDKVDIVYCDYDNVNKEVKEFIDSDSLLPDDMCFITDISITDELATEIDAKYDNVYLLDHHPTALRLNRFTWCEVDIEDIETGIKTSGTEMFYKLLTFSMGYLFHIETLDKFVELVRNYDTWRWSTLGEDGFICKQINDLFHMYGKEKFINWCLSEIHDEVFPKLYAKDKMLLDMKQKEIDDYVSLKNQQMFTSPMCGRVCGFVFAEKYFSELGNRLCTMHPEIDFVAMIDMDGTVSYRTIRDDIDLGKDVAKLFGGGGHPKAAGSQFSDGAKMKLIENIFR